MPSFSFAHRVNEKADTLVVRGVEPEHAGKNIVGFFEPAEPPQAETVAMQTPEEGTVVGEPPEKDAVMKPMARKELAETVRKVLDGQTVGM